MKREKELTATTSGETLQESCALTREEQSRLLDSMLERSAGWRTR